MNNFPQLFLIICALIFCMIVFLLILKHKISEKNSIIWLGFSILVLLLAGEPEVLDTMANLLHIDYPPSLLFLLSILLLLLFNLYQSIQIYKLNIKIKDITQYLALKEDVDIKLCRKNEQISWKKNE